MRTPTAREILFPTSAEIDAREKRAEVMAFFDNTIASLDEMLAISQAISALEMLGAACGLRGDS